MRTIVSEMLGIECPIVLAGMGGASHPKLAAAVSNAGGLGVLGAAACNADQLREWIRETRTLTDRPFGVDTLLPASVRRQAAAETSGPSPMDEMAAHREFARAFAEREGLEVRAAKAPSSAGNEREKKPQRSLFSKDFFAEQMEVVIEEKVPVYAAGLGDPGPWIDRLHANGTVVMAVVGAVRHARRVAESGVDLIVAQGHDAGGHNSPVGTMALVPQVVDAVDQPVLAAGGISDGRGIAAAMMLGAKGVWLGSVFLATDEANILPFQKQAILDATEEGTVVSRSVTGKPARLIRNKWSQAYAESDLEPLPMPFQTMVAAAVLQAGTREERADIVPGFAGQGIGMIHEIRPAADVLRELVRDAEATLATAKTLDG